MPALNFKARFSVPVETGIETQTIRHKRKYPIRIGGRLALYAEMHTKRCRKILEATCSMKREIGITESGVKIEVSLPRAATLRPAQGDGCERIDRFRASFRANYGLPFSGKLIEWHTDA